MAKKKLRKYNPFCDFCATQNLLRCAIDERVVLYNKRAHVKTATAGYGVIINAYIRDNHSRVAEKKSKTFVKYRYCPMCGYDYKNELFLVDGVYRKEPPTFD